MPHTVLVQGDTNTVLAGALAASKLGIKVGHVEAGLRSYDRSMPEELNRVVADHLSDYLFAPTEAARGNLLREGIEDRKISVTGNTIVDAVNQNLRLTEALNLPEPEPPGDYFLLTLHRQENVDDKGRLGSIMKGLALVSERLGKPILYPAHPRARKRLLEFGIQIDSRIRLMDPQDYLAFLRLEKCAALILTDSGGVQEEACILGVPCVTLRENTERPETLDVGANALAGTNPEAILAKASMMLASNRRWRNPFGDGQSAKRILDIVRQDPVFKPAS
jgi:UDP-N-acetylglucosamine 2-epimerase (non-hydrolysing)